MERTSRTTGAGLVLVGLLLLMAVACLAALPARACAAGQTASLSIPVVKQVVGDVPPTSERFAFALVPKGAHDPMPAGSNAQGSLLFIEGSGTACFGEITYTEPNDYYYTVREVSQSMGNYTMDTTEYTALVQVTTDDKGNLQADLFVYRANMAEKCASLTFVNEYASPANALAAKTGDAMSAMFWGIVAVAAVAVVAAAAAMAAVLRAGRRAKAARNDCDK